MWTIVGSSVALVILLVWLGFSFIAYRKNTDRVIGILLGCKILVLIFFNCFVFVVLLLVCLNKLGIPTFYFGDLTKLK